ncbi:hypothetical protein EU527_19065 [Candidatus Thorarchaeota archaeon]|nr:MAG: hypothetical protein EU527_19065 [Candidatus Thorarchaeota archaeon]
MVGRDFLFAVLIGVCLFLSDFVTGWLTSISAGIPVIFIMAIIIGIIAGTVTNGLFATALTWIISIPLGILIAPVVLPEYIGPDADLFVLAIFVPLWALRGTFNYQSEGNFLETIIAGLGYLVIIIFIGPVIYVVSVTFGILGGVIGKLLRNVLKREIKNQTSVYN